MNIAIIVQARLGSTRLPRKVLAEAGGKPLLSYVVERVRMSRCSPVVVVCPEGEQREIAAAAAGAFVYSGPEHDVRERFVRYLQGTVGFQHFVRICADSPWIDPKVIDYVVAAHRMAWPENTSLARGLAFVTSNTKPRSFPAGQCVEVADVAGFLTGNKIGRVGRGEPVGDAMTDSDREHVFPWYYRNCPTANVVNPLGDYSHVNLCVDTAEDFERFSDVIGRLERPHWAYGWREIAEMYA